MLVFALADFVYDEDVRMVQSGSGFGFAHEAFQIRFVLTEFFVENFNSNAAVEFLIFRKINFAHPPDAETGDDTVMIDRLPHL